MKIVKVDLKKRKDFNKAINNAKIIIKKGGVIVCPTDTVYGLCCNALERRAVKKNFKIKKRPEGKPISIFVKDLKTAKKFAKINKEQEEFLREVWPGKVTVILEVKNKKIFPMGILSKNNKIALRIPDYKLVNDLLKKLNLPLTGTSANISGRPAFTKIEKVISQFRNQKCQPDLILNTGDLKPSKPSTVLDLTSLKLKIIRK